MFGRQPDGSEVPAAMELVRLAIPRRTYTQSHIDYVIEVVIAVASDAQSLRGYQMTHEPKAFATSPPATSRWADQPSRETVHREVTRLGSLKVNAMNVRHLH